MTCSQKNVKKDKAKQKVVCDNDILYRCIEEVKDNKINVTKYFPDGHVEYETKQPENII
jgi:hypothetical protein